MPQESYFPLLQQEDFLFETSAPTGTVYTIAANQIKSNQINTIFLLSAMKYNHKAIMFRQMSICLFQPRINDFLLSLNPFLITSH